MTLPAKNKAHCTTVSFSRPVFSCIVTAKLYIYRGIVEPEAEVDGFTIFAIHNSLGFTSSVWWFNSTQFIFRGVQRRLNSRFQIIFALRSTIQVWFLESYGKLEQNQFMRYIKFPPFIYCIHLQSSANTSLLQIFLISSQLTYLLSKWQRSKVSYFLSYFCPEENKNSSHQWVDS